MTIPLPQMADRGLMLVVFECAALDAGAAILAIHRAGPNTRYKGDSSPVTEADEQAEAIILAAVRNHLGQVPIVAEEAAAAGIVPDIEGGAFLLVDPLDGTKEFIAGHDDFTVNIALIEAGVPTAGVVYAPALGLAYVGNIPTDGKPLAEKLWVDADFQIIRREPMRVRNLAAPHVALASRSHRSPETDAFLIQCGAAEIMTVGSSLKFCMIAEGAADIYPRFGRTMEWDTAAGDAVLRASGGMTFDLEGKPLLYGKTGRADCADFANPDFVARCSLSLDADQN